MAGSRLTELVNRKSWFMALRSKPTLFPWARCPCTYRPSLYSARRKQGRLPLARQQIMNLPKPLRVRQPVAGRIVLAAELVQNRPPFLLGHLDAEEVVDLNGYSLYFLGVGIPHVPANDCLGGRIIHVPVLVEVAAAHAVEVRKPRLDVHLLIVTDRRPNGDDRQAGPRERLLARHFRLRLFPWAGVTQWRARLPRAGRRRGGDARILDRRGQW